VWSTPPLKAKDSDGEDESDEEEIREENPEEAEEVEEEEAPTKSAVRSRKSTRPRKDD